MTYLEKGRKVRHSPQGQGANASSGNIAIAQDSAFVKDDDISDFETRSVRKGSPID